jgi:hypothetical protein
MKMYECKSCEYKINIKSRYEIHLTTLKHNKNIKTSKNNTKINSSAYNKFIETYTKEMEEDEQREEQESYEEKEKKLLFKIHILEIENAYNNHVITRMVEIIKECMNAINFIVTNCKDRPSVLLFKKYHQLLEKGRKIITETDGIDNNNYKLAIDK